MISTNHEVKDILQISCRSYTFWVTVTAVLNRYQSSVPSAIEIKAFWGKGAGAQNMKKI